MSDVRVTEGDSGTRTAKFTVTRGGSLRRGSSVRFATSGGTAKAGKDYTTRSGRLSFARGQAKKLVTVSIRGDRADESNEAFFLRLSRPAGARLGRGKGRATIRDDDASPVAGAGADRSVFVVDAVELDGRASTDADGDSLSYVWTIVTRPAGSTAALRGASTATPGFDPDGPGVYVIRLVATDSVNSDADTVSVTVSSQVVRFVVTGAQGKGNVGQISVANAMDAKCDLSGCDYIIGVGNNIYDSGASSTSDPELTTKFVTPYAGIDLPFWLGLGNHDYGANGADFLKALNEINYSAVNPKWRMPSHYYRRTDKHVEFFTLDTNGEWLSNPATTSQGADVAGWLSSSSAYWKIALGLHGYRSNGPHGNAGSYEGLPSFNFSAGARVRDFIEDRICGKAQVYFSAHDHSLQWPQQDAVNCPGTELVVSGAGAATTELDDPPSYPTHFQSLALGFAYVVIRDRQLTLEFVDTSGTTLFTRTITR